MPTVSLPYGRGALTAELPARRFPGTLCPGLTEGAAPSQEASVPDALAPADTLLERRGIRSGSILAIPGGVSVIVS